MGDRNADSEQPKDAAFNAIVNNIQALIDACLQLKPIVDGPPILTTPGTKSRVENLPALRKEIEIMEKLGACFRGIITRHFYEEEEEESKKPLEYSKGLRLPQEIIARIVSFVPSNNLFTWSSRSCLRARIFGPGIPFIAIFYPTLLQPHFDKVYDPNWTLADIAYQEIKWSILEEKNVVQHMLFDLMIRTYAPTGSGRDQTMIYSLLRFSKHWRVLKIQLKSTRDLTTMLRLCIPCIPYLDCLEASAYDGKILHPSDLIPNTQIPVNATIKASSSLKSLRVSFNLLRAFFDVGLCEYVTKLAPVALSEYDFADEEFKFRHVLSNMPCLRKLHVPHLPDYVPDGLSPIKSKSLRHVTVICGSEYSPGDPTIVVSFLKLFVECPIDCLELWIPPEPTLESISELFPGLRHLIYRKGQELEILSTSEQNGKLRFPQLERLTLIEYNREDGDEIRNQIIEVARIRTCTPGIVPLKMISVHESYASDSLMEELKKYVPFVEKNNGPS